MYLYKVGTRPGVLIKQGVLISEGFHVYICTHYCLAIEQLWLAEQNSIIFDRCA